MFSPNSQLRNYAPLASLLALPRRASTEHYLNDFLRDAYNHFIKQDEQAWREVYETGRVISNCVSGKLVMKRDPIFHEPFFSKPSKKHQNNRTGGNFKFYFKQLAANYLNSSPDVDPAIIGDHDQAEQAVAAIKQAHDYYENKIFNDLYQLREFNSATRFGTYILRLSDSDRLDQLKQLKPVVENRTETLYPGFGACLSCQYESDGADFHEATEKSFSPFPICPKCESPDVVLDDALEIEAARVTDVEEIDAFDISGSLMEFEATRYDMRRLPEESGYLIYQQLLPIGQLRSILGDIDLQESDGTSENFGFSIMEALATRGGSVEGAGMERQRGLQNAFRKTALLTEFWLKPEQYADVPLKGDERTVCGENLPPGAKLVDLFPNGLCAVGVNGMETVIALYGENHSEKICTGLYHLASNSGIGEGLGDAVGAFKEYNSILSSCMTTLERFGSPGFRYIKDAIDEADVKNIGKPDKAIPVDPRALPDDFRDLDQIVKQFDSGTPNPAMFVALNQWNNALQLAFGITEFSEGMPGVDNKTATGAAIGRDYARKQSVVSLRLKAWQRKEAAGKIINLFRKTATAARWFAKDDKFGLTKGSLISGSDIPEHIQWTVVRDSEMPRTEFDERIDTEALFAQAGGMLGFAQIKQFDPELASWAAKKYKLDIPGLNANYIEMVCRSRVQDIKRAVAEHTQEFQMLVAVTGIMPETPDIVETILTEKLVRPLSITEKGHLLQAEWLQELLFTDEIVEAEPIVRNCIEGLIVKHVELDAAQKFEFQRKQQDVQMALQLRAQEQQAQMQLGMQAQQMQMEGEAAKAQNQMEQENAQKERKNKFVDDELAHERNLELEKERGKMKQQQNGKGQK